MDFDYNIADVCAPPALSPRFGRQRAEQSSERKVSADSDTNFISFFSVANRFSIFYLRNLILFGPPYKPAWGGILVQNRTKSCRSNLCVLFSIISMIEFPNNRLFMKGLQLLSVMETRFDFAGSDFNSSGPNSSPHPPASSNSPAPYAYQAPYSRHGSYSEGAGFDSVWGFIHDVAVNQQQFLTPSAQYPPPSKYPGSGYYPYQPPSGYLVPPSGGNLSSADSLAAQGGPYSFNRPKTPDYSISPRSEDGSGPPQGASTSSPSPWRHLHMEDDSPPTLGPPRGRALSSWPPMEPRPPVPQHHVFQDAEHPPHPQPIPHLQHPQRSPPPQYSQQFQGPPSGRPIPEWMNVPRDPFNGEVFSSSSRAVSSENRDSSSSSSSHSNHSEGRGGQGFGGPAATIPQPKLLLSSSRASNPASSLAGPPLSDHSMDVDESEFAVAFSDERRSSQTNLQTLFRVDLGGYAIPPGLSKSLSRPVFAPRADSRRFMLGAVASEEFNEDLKEKNQLIFFQFDRRKIREATSVVDSSTYNVPVVWKYSLTDGVKDILWADDNHIFMALANRITMVQLGSDLNVCEACDFPAFHSDDIREMALRDMHLLLSGGFDGNVFVTDVVKLADSIRRNDTAARNRIYRCGEVVGSVSWHPSEQYLASCTTDNGSVRIFDTRTEKHSAALVINTGSQELYCHAYRDSSTLLLGYGNGRMKAVDYRMNRKFARCRLPCVPQIRFLTSL